MTSPIMTATCCCIAIASTFSGPAAEYAAPNRLEVEKRRQAKTGSDKTKHGAKCATTEIVKQAIPAWRSARDTRRLALALYEYPYPDFSRRDLARRWQVSGEVVSRILKTASTSFDRMENSRIALPDVLCIEGDSNPIRTWVEGSTTDRENLVADLLTLNEWVTLTFGAEARERTKYYRSIAEWEHLSIRIGRQHRFRPGGKSLKIGSCDSGGSDEVLHVPQCLYHSDLLPVDLSRRS